MYSWVMVRDWPGGPIGGFHKPVASGDKWHHTGIKALEKSFENDILVLKPGNVKKKKICEGKSRTKGNGQYISKMAFCNAS